MLSVDAALQSVLEFARPNAPCFVPTGEVLGLVLAESIASDIDSPPYDKSQVDGYALIAAEIAAGRAELKVLEEVTAGDIPRRTVEPGTTTRIMTGAPIPPGADAVVMFEQTTLASADTVHIRQTAVKSGQNIMRRAASLACGQIVLEAGKVLRAIEVGLLAEVGRQRVLTFPRPKVLVIATGNELVEHMAMPGPGQIRNSNSLLLTGLATAAGASSTAHPIVRDEAFSLREAISAGLDYDVVVLSGGVSAGVLDLVPSVLAELGVEQVFHKVNLKPGKPLWFGVKQHPESDRPTLVFGLPGNPVSGLVCFELFVRPAIERLTGRHSRGLTRVAASLTQEHRQRGDRPTYWPAVLGIEADRRLVTPLPWQGSGDLRTLTDANCLAFFPTGDRAFAAGETIEVLLFD
jgi:molybdopterin molybdotransferase